MRDLYGVLGFWGFGVLRHELDGRNVLQARVRSVAIVIVLPSSDLLPGLAQGRKERLVQELVAEPTVEAFDEAVLQGLPGAM